MGEFEEADEKKQERMQGCALLATLMVAVVLVAVAVGMFFGAQWGVAAVAAFAVLMFARMLHNVRMERRKNGGDAL